ncbi:MAG TPA: fasciclin domain-containing protein [Sphingorhabdus sp.]|nr:fasciclin domain-containing protein [Sphingorhabdus sp.]
MKKNLFKIALATAAIASATTIGHAHNHGHGSHSMAAPKTNIVEAAVATPDLSTLVTAVKAAGLVDTLASPGPFTVFAPTNAAFGKLPAGTVETLVKPENKGTLTTVLTYHVVAGTFDSKAIAAAIKSGNGKATLTTVQGQKLTASMYGDKLIVTDAKGGKSTVALADLRQKNGVVHVIDSVLMP